VQAAPLRAVGRPGGDRAEDLARLDPGADCHRRQHRFVGGPQRGLAGAGVGDRDHVGARDRPHEGDHPRSGRPDRGSRLGGQVHSPVPGGPGQRWRIETAEHVGEGVAHRVADRAGVGRRVRVQHDRGVRRVRWPGQGHGQPQQDPEPQQQRPSVRRRPGRRRYGRPGGGSGTGGGGTGGSVAGGSVAGDSGTGGGGTAGTGRAGGRVHGGSSGGGSGAGDGAEGAGGAERIGSHDRTLLARTASSALEGPVCGQTPGCG
jgi:hypothetical protein